MLAESKRRTRLILTRRIGETIRIGDAVEVTVLGTKDCQVRMGITAPREIPVHREEVYERIKKENESTCSETHESEVTRGDQTIDLAAGPRRNRKARIAR